MTETVGYATLQVIPSTRGFQSALTQQTTPVMSRVGTTSGGVFGTKLGQSAGRNFGQQFRSSSSGYLRSVGTTLAVLGAGSLIKSAVDLEATYSTTLRQIGVAANVPADRLKALDDLALKLGQDTIFSANDAAQAMLELAKNGIAPATIQAGALRSALTLAAAGGVPLADAAKTMGNALQAFALDGQDSASVAAALAGAANASSASVGSLAEALQQSSAVAHDTGLNVQETTAALAAFANAGIAGSDAGTSLKTFLARLVPQTEKAAGAAKNLGLEFTNTDGSFKSLADISQQLSDGLAGLSASERAAALNTIFGSDARRAATVLTREGAEGIEKYIRATSDQTQAQKLADAQMKGTSGALEQLSGAFDTAKLQLGKGLAPAVKELADAATDFISTHDIEAGVGAFVDGAKDLGETMAPIAQNVLPAAADALESIVAAGKGAAELFGGVAESFGKLPDPLQSFTLQAGAAVFVMTKLKTAIGGSALVSSVASFSSNIRNAETRMVALQSAAKTAAGAGGLLLLVDGLSDTEDKFSGLKTTLGGTAAGFAAGGPWGAAIGFATGALLAFTNQSDDAARAQEHLDTLASQLTDTLNEQTGALTAATKDKIFQDIKASGLIDQAKEFGVGAKLIIDFATGSEQAYDRLVKKFEQAIPTAPIKKTADEIAHMSLAEQDAYYARQQDYQDARDKFDAFREAILGEKAAVDQSVQEWRQHRRAVGLNIVDAKAYQKIVGSLPQEARTAFRAEGMDATLRQVQNLAEKFKLTTGQKKAVFTAYGFDKAAAQVDAFRTKIEGKPAKLVVVPIFKDVRGAFKLAGGLFKNADGGYISGHGGPKADNMLSLVSNGEFVQQASAVSYYGRAFMEALNKRQVPRFANGGAPGPSVPSGNTYSSQASHNYHVYGVRSMREIDAEAQRRSRATSNGSPVF